MSDDQRTTILAELAKHTGRRVSWRFIKQTGQFIPGIERFHNLITGIFKPSWSAYALAVTMAIGSPYEKKDDVLYLDDGRWLMTYSPRSADATSNRNRALSDNRALLKCQEDRVPIGVFQQLTDKTDRQRSSTYLVLGLALVTAYDPKADVFILESADFATVERVTTAIREEAVRYEVQLYAQVTNAFRAFSPDEPAWYETLRLKRQSAFSRIILNEYGFTCAVCEMRCRLGDLTEATAAHIVPKQSRGTDDPRNGIALCRTHHWAFDQGIFTIGRDYTLEISPVLAHADTHHFDLTEMRGKTILLPGNDSLRPHPIALDWHHEHVFRHAG